MKSIPEIFEHNRNWSKQVTDSNPGFFENLAKGQSPRYLWIGCSDSRVPATQICGMDPGDMFVHRNVANLVSPDDTSALAAIQFSVHVLKVRDVIVCGHYGCGGVHAALNQKTDGPIDHWLDHIRKDFKEPQNSSDKETVDQNVRNQVRHLSELEVIQSAWENNQDLTLHGWVYNIEDGLLRDLEISVSGPK